MEIKHKARIYSREKLRKINECQGWLSWQRTPRVWGSRHRKRSPERRQLYGREGSRPNALKADASYKKDNHRNRDFLGY